MKTRLFFASSALAATMWAVPSQGAAHFFAPLPLAPRVDVAAQTAPVRFRIDRQRGLMVRVWLNGSGPFNFVLDTGAGMNVISQRVVTEKRLSTRAVAT